MKLDFKPGTKVRAKGGQETGTIERYDGENFYIVGVRRNDGKFSPVAHPWNGAVELLHLVVHEDDLELA